MFVEAENDQSWHPLPTPDDGMVMVPEKLGDHETWWYDFCKAIKTGKRASAYTDFINHFKEADQ